MPIEVQELTADIAPPERGERDERAAESAPAPAALAGLVLRELDALERRRQRLSAD